MVCCGRLGVAVCCLRGMVVLPVAASAAGAGVANVPGISTHIYATAAGKQRFLTGLRRHMLQEVPASMPLLPQLLLLLLRSQHSARGIRAAVNGGYGSFIGSPTGVVTGGS